MLPWASILSGVSYYEKLFGKDIMVYVSTCYYIPALPIFVAQMLLDQRFDKKLGSRNAYRLRISFSLFGNILSLISLRFAEKKSLLMM